MKRTIAAVIGLTVLLFAAMAAHGLLMVEHRGSWPDDWPAEMEPLRKQARTLEFASATHEKTYEITFADRESFERAWPAIVSVKTPGAPLTLYAISPGTEKDKRAPFSQGTPIVRIRAPIEHEIGQPGSGLRLKCGPPWPQELLGPSGELPEYVRADWTGDKPCWVAAEMTTNKPVFTYRARVDLVLAIDGQIIDLNRIRLPDNTPVKDRRFDSPISVPATSP